jgi:pyruvate dehydrogenase E1 component alpha subunit/2-oxoisovalerate dehydrogenase E1 component alpha subunit
VRGYTAKEMMCQFLGRANSPTGGKDCALHFSDIEGRGVVGCISMLGTLVPVMAGVALAAKMQRRNAVALTYIGDGATSTGEFHEGLNFAAVLRVPLVLIIENNQWSYATPVEKQTRIKDLARKADGYGIPGIVADGNDILEVLRVTRQCVEAARSGAGPQVIEFKTFRMRGHARHDDAKYVPKKVLEHWKRRDPVLLLEKHLHAHQLITESEALDIHESVGSEVREAEAFALASPHPEGAQALQGVYADDSIVANVPWWAS